MKKKIFGSAVAILLGSFLLADIYYKKHRAASLGFMAQENASTFVRPHSPIQGNADAKVYVVKFTDPACETCAAFAGFMEQGMAVYPGKIKLVIRYAPFHDGASDIVRILEAAKKQEKFWETLHLLYASQDQWTAHHQVRLDRVWPLLPRAGLDVARVRKDMNDPEFARIIEQDLADARTLGVHKTPGFFVNGKPLEPFGTKELKELIEGEIRAQYPP